MPAPTACRRSQQLALRVDGAPVTLDAQGRATIVAPAAGKLRWRPPPRMPTDWSATGTHHGSKCAIHSTRHGATSVVCGTGPSLLATQADADGGDRRGPEPGLVEAGDRGTGHDRTSHIGCRETRLSTTARLMLLDPNEFTNGFYRLVLTARDISGRESQTETALEMNTPAKSTAYRRTETDLVWTLPGATFTLTRTYDSLRRHTAEATGIWLESRFPGSRSADERSADRPGTTGHLPCIWRWHAVVSDAA